MRNRLKSSRIISAMICALLVITMIPTYAFAGNDALRSSEAAFDYVAIGDASTAGFGMAEDSGYGVLTEGTYPAVLADSLRANGLNVNVSQLAMGGMRTEELRYLLDDSYDGDAYLKENFPGLRRIRSEYRSAIKNAELITVELGTVDFGAFLLYVAGDIEKNCDDPQVKALAAADADGVKASLRAALDAEIAKIPGTIRSAASGMGYNIDDLVNQYADPYLGAAAYAYYSFCLGYDESLRKIHEINPEADIIVLGLNNMLGDMSLNVLDVNFGLGALYNEHVVKRANAHLKNAEGIYQFIDTNDIERFLNEVASYDAKPENISQQFKDYCDIYEDDFQLKKQLEKDLASYNDSAKQKAYNAAYDTVEQCLQSVTGINGESFDLSSLLYAKDNVEKIQAMSVSLMAGIKAKSLEYANESAKRVFVYKSKLNSFINGNGTREGAMYGSDKTERLFGRVIMAIGIRAAMGDGFFQQPSVKGHAMLASKIMDVYKDRKLHRTAAEAECDKPGNAEYWLVVATGKYYSDEACTQEISAGEVFTAPLEHKYELVPGTALDPTCIEEGHKEDKKCSVCDDILGGECIPPLGHDFGPAVVVEPAAFCKDGKSTVTCRRCGLVQENVIPGKGPAKTSLKKLKAAKKAITVTWKLPSKANLKKTTGYEIRYSLKSSMASSKTVTVANNKTTSKAIKKLKAKKKYYVQIRTYKKSGSKKYYSTWSGKKSVKTK